MPPAVSRMSVSAQSRVLRGVFRVPVGLRRMIGPPPMLDGQVLDSDAHLLLALQRISGVDLADRSPASARQEMLRGIRLLGGAVVEPVDVRSVPVPGPAGELGARLYTPAGLAAPSPLLVYYHGGGWVVGDLDTHDNLCRLLAREAEVRVLAVDYRLAPEHPFPAAPADALAAFRHAVSHAGELGADPDAIAVGGDSAGGNLATVTAYQAARDGGPAPVFQLLIYPATDLTGRTRSREVFAEGVFLTGEDITWFMDNYCPDVDRRGDPLCSPLLADDLSGMAPAFLVTAGFDPLRDEGAEYADRLRAAGVAVVHRNHTGLIHGFASMFGVGASFRGAVLEMVGALRTGIELGRGSRS